MDTAVPATREPPQPSVQNFEFSGNGGEYFRIWIVNLALSIVTLGIFSAWAKVRRLKYFYGHTTLDGHNFDYLADPKRILVGRIIAVVLLLLYSQGTTLFPRFALYIVVFLLLMLPFIIVSASAFSFRNTSYRNIRFHFRKDLGTAYRKVAVPFVIALAGALAMYFAMPEELAGQDGEVVPRGLFLPTLVILWLLPFFPWLDHMRCHFVIERLQYGRTEGSFHAGIGAFYWLYFRMFMAIIGAVLTLGLIFVVGVVSQNPGLMDGSSEGTPSAPPIRMLATGLVLFYALLFCVMGWFTAARNNLLRNNTRIGGRMLSGNFGAGDMIWLVFSNTIAIICTLGLFTPWAGIRIARYNAAHTTMDVAGLEETVAEAVTETDAIGEEIGEFFDIDIGL